MSGLHILWNPAQIGDHGVSLVNMEKMEKMENVNQMTWINKIFDSKRSLYDSKEVVVAVVSVKVGIEDPQS